MKTTPLLAALAMLPMTAPAAQPSDPHPQETSLLKFERPQKWTLTSRSLLLAYEDIENVARRSSVNRQGTRAKQDVYLEEWEFESLSMVYPVVWRSASSVSPNQRVTGELSVGETTVDTDGTTIGPYGSQALYSRWDAPAGVADEVELEVTIDFISYETVFDEEAAMLVGWPSYWPVEAESTFLPQQFVSLDPSGETPETGDDTIKVLLDHWTGGQDPQSIPPVQLAKFLAGQVQEYVRLIRPGTTTRRTGDGRITAAARTLSGFEVKTASETAREKAGTVHDMTVLLTAIYREAGLPARLVIGYQESEDDGNDRLSVNEKLRSWVEFAIFDETKPDGGELTWVPVDIGRLRKRSSRAYPLGQKWKYFGNHDELDDTVPVAFHFHPPTEVRSYAAVALFGITMNPTAPVNADQYIDLNISRTPTRSKQHDDYRP